MKGIKEYALKKGISDKNELDKLDNFFNNHEIMGKLEEAEKNRIKRYMWLIPSCTIIFVGILYFASLGIIPIETAENSGIYRDSNIFDGIYWGILGAFAVFGIILAIFHKKIEGAIKENILTKLSKEIYINLEYNQGGKYSFGEVDKLKNANFLNSYQKIDKMEDSIAFTIKKDGKYVVVQGYELQTSEVRGTGKKRKRVITNKCYLLKAVIPSAKINLEKDLFIVKDKADSKGNIIGISLISSIILSIFVGIFSQNFIFTIISFTTVFILIYFIYNKSLNNKRVKLENIDFEKLYDVKCEDQVASRMIITPAFMDRLVTFSKKSNKSYEFLFRNNTFYVKWNISGSYLEINTWKKITTNIETFLDWYMEMKEIIFFVYDMQILYLSKTEQKYLDNVEVAIPEYQVSSELAISEKNTNFFGNMFNQKFTLK